MAGVLQHSDFRADPWGRLRRTADYVGVVTFGSTAEVERIGRKVRGLHATDRGVDGATGVTYRASDPHLLRWVHCCEVESFLSTAVRCGLRLSPSERDAYYAEQTVGSALVGLDPADIPASVDEMAAYFRRMQPELRVTAEARRAATFVLWPPMPTRVQLGTPARPAWIALASAAFAMLPRWARRLYRLPGLPTTDVAATAAGLALRSGLLVVPDRLRHGPALKEARARMGV